VTDYLFAHRRSYVKVLNQQRTAWSRTRDLLKFNLVLLLLLLNKLKLKSDALTTTPVLFLIPILYIFLYYTIEGVSKLF